MVTDPDTQPNPLLASTELPDFGSIKPEHVRAAVRKVLDEQRAELEQLAAVNTPSIDWLREIERVLERVHDVWFPVSHMNSVVSTPELRDAYNEALEWITEFYTDLGQNEALYAQFESLSETLTAEPEAELIRQSLRDFRLAGVALTGDAKDAFRAASLRLATRESEFDQNVMDATDAFSYHETSPDELAGLPDEIIERAAASAREENTDGWVFKLNPPTYQAVMTHADSASLRERYYRAWVTRASEQGNTDWDNGPLIEEILALRQQQADLLGFGNFAGLSLARKMAKSETRVIEFLEDLATRSRAMAEQERDALEAFAERKLEAWDVAYYAEKLKQQRFEIGDEELRAYFPLPKVLTGLFDMAEKLFGLGISERSGVALWHETARCFELRNSDGSRVGTLLTDFYTRPNKRGGAWMDTCINRSRLGTVHRDPVAHLVCNFAPPTEKSPSYITHDEVLTLFHEFGHCLHHLLTEIDYPSIAGINGVAWDAVELPSQFLENYAWDPDVLKAISAHRQTGESIPDEKIERLLGTRTFLAGLAMLRQLEFSLFDFRLHTRTTPVKQDEVQTLLDSVRREVAVLQAPAFNRFQCSFGHIFAGGYAAGYYSYKWAEVLAADAFSAFEETGIFDPETAGRFRSSILAVGGSRDAMDAFVAFRGREPELDPLLRQSGIAA
ncbi:MAG TPA: M3 family metallopeptidase [Gammaproteobacteria bacterium]